MQGDSDGTTTIFSIGITWAALVFAVILALFCVVWVCKRWNGRNRK
ncbi:hypothetical protein BCF46_3659 [Litoreibacter meonggei]|uniref:Uncharacterized protein n=1 Tax=Litoreibacter meonggei TaxID=1049199 RepID=A0A497VEB5_9RHOB|nr:hypothetical protein BCF46_3659 [Litoreibacter meonggei]